jgi:hypothetical protein
VFVLLTNVVIPMQSEAVVNGGPAVFISPTGPNHIMVQVLHLSYALLVMKTITLLLIEMHGSSLFLFKLEQALVLSL